jgi:hypothetical protein
MSARLDDFNKKFVYTKTNPEGIIAAKKNALFYRIGNDFYLNPDGFLEKPWQKLPYKTVIIPPPPSSKRIEYEKPNELWIKTTDGFFDEFNNLMPKSGWKFYSYKKVNLDLIPKKLNWLFPPPKSTNDPVGVNGNRSYDNFFFYAKILGKWYRTPLANFTFPSVASGDRPELTANLPFVDLPRAALTIYNSSIRGCSNEGDQTYDRDFFYIRVNSNTWKRARLSIFNSPHKMSRF